jgi:KDO2-lipid IV(A) lauroyltransferase
MSWKTFRRAARMRALLVALPVLRLLPHRLALALGALLGSLAWLVVGKERRRALEGLQVAFPDESDAFRRKVGRSSFANLGRAALELFVVDRIPLRERVVLDAASEKLLRDAHAEGHGVVLVSAHIGNWELLARRLSLLGFPSAIVAREAQDPRLTALLQSARSAGGVRVIWRGMPRAPLEMLRLLREGGMLGILIDQDTGVQGQFVPFFGKPAFTPRAAGDFAVRTGAPVVFGCVHRVAKTLHQVVLRRVDVPRTGDREADSLAITAAATRAIEDEIRRRPDEWVWMHRRWRTAPGS